MSGEVKHKNLKGSNFHCNKIKKELTLSAINGGNETLNYSFDLRKFTLVKTICENDGISDI